MMPNNPIQDRYNPPGTSAQDWDKNRFGEITNGELFWLKPELDKYNHAFRKIDDTQAQDTRTQEIHKVARNRWVFQKI